MAPATTALAASRRTNVLLVSVAAAIGSLKVAVSAGPVLTPVAPRAGVTLVIVGAVVSAVVKDHASLLASALPATSFTPALPPETVAVYVVDEASAEEGVRMATRVFVL